MVDLLDVFKRLKRLPNCEAPVTMTYTDKGFLAPRDSTMAQCSEMVKCDRWDRGTTRHQVKERQRLYLCNDCAAALGLMW